MFKYISEILKSFSPTQRIIALLILVFSIIVITLGPSLIDSKNESCDELDVRIESQKKQILELNGRVNELSNQLLSNQTECTNNLISKQKEIMNLINDVIYECEHLPQTETRLEKLEYRVMTDENGNELEQMPRQQEIIYLNDHSEVIKKLKSMKYKVEKNIKNK